MGYRIPCFLVSNVDDLDEDLEFLCISAWCMHSPVRALWDDDYKSELIPCCNSSLLPFHHFTSCNLCQMNKWIFPIFYSHYGLCQEKWIVVGFYCLRIIGELWGCQGHSALSGIMGFSWLQFLTLLSFSHPDRAMVYYRPKCFDWWRSPGPLALAPLYGYNLIRCIWWWDFCMDSA